jgi:formyltetrahydrofolate synthetase
MGTFRPTRVDKRVMNPLLDIVDHSLRIVTSGVGTKTDARSRLKDFMFVVAADCRGNVHLQQLNHALLVVDGYRSLRNRLDVAVAAEAAVADWTQPLNLQMPSTQ